MHPRICPKYALYALKCSPWYPPSYSAFIIVNTILQELLGSLLKLSFEFRRVKLPKRGMACTGGCKAYICLCTTPTFMTTELSSNLSIPYHLLYFKGLDTVTYISWGSYTTRRVVPARVPAVGFSSVHVSEGLDSHFGHDIGEQGYVQSD